MGVLNELHRFLEPRAMTIIDGGASYGDSVDEFLVLFPGSRIIAFEPASENYARLAERHGASPGVEMVRGGLHARTGTATLYKNNHDATHSIFPFDEAVINRWSGSSDFVALPPETVSMHALDDFAAAQGIAQIDLLKLDLQGGELEALRGAEGLLRNQNIGCIFAEVEFVPLYQSQPLFADIDAFLRAHGYHFVTFVAPHDTELGVTVWADALYVDDARWRALEARHRGSKAI